jgi:hypothetical protein
MVAFDKRFYLDLDGERDVLDLHPFLMALRCRECLNRHLYYPDKLSDRHAVLNSIDRGHARREDDHALIAQLQAAVPRPAPSEQ